MRRLLPDKDKNIDYFNGYLSTFFYYFKTRLTRKYYWLSLLVVLILALLIAFLSTISVLQNICSLATLAIIFLLVSITVRRLHDINLNGYFIFVMMCIPILGWYYLALLWFGKTVPADRYFSPKQTFKNGFQYDGKYKYRGLGNINEKTRATIGFILNAFNVTLLLYINLIIAITCFSIFNHFLLIFSSGDLGDLTLSMFLAILMPVIVVCILFYRKKVKRPVFSIFNTIVWISSYFVSLAVVAAQKI